MGEGVATLGIEAQSARARGLEGRGGLRIAAGEQRDLMPLADQFLGQMGDDALGAAVTAGRTTFVQWGNLSNPHPR